MFNASRTFRGAPATAATGGALLWAPVELPELILEEPDPKYTITRYKYRLIDHIRYKCLID